ncbi:MAG: hypothetical protein KGM99_05220, partial [Burkholderiales bacterium]|nr:hypothetical protein [Burkholderiales bacterium]
SVPDSKLGNVGISRGLAPRTRHQKIFRKLACDPNANFAGRGSIVRSTYFLQLQNTSSKKFFRRDTIGPNNAYFLAKNKAAAD